MVCACCVRAVAVAGGVAVVAVLGRRVAGWLAVLSYLFLVQRWCWLIPLFRLSLAVCSCACLFFLFLSVSLGGVLSV